MYAISSAEFVWILLFEIEIWKIVILLNLGVFSHYRSHQCSVERCQVIQEQAQTVYSPNLSWLMPKLCRLLLKRTQCTTNLPKLLKPKLIIRLPNSPILPDKWRHFFFKSNSSYMLINQNFIWKMNRLNWGKKFRGKMSWYENTMRGFRNGWRCYRTYSSNRGPLLARMHQWHHLLRRHRLLRILKLGQRVQAFLVVVLRRGHFSFWRKRRQTSSE